MFWSFPGLRVVFGKCLLPLAACSLAFSRSPALSSPLSVFGNSPQILCLLCLRLLCCESKKGLRRKGVAAVCCLVNAFALAQASCGFSGVFPQLAMLWRRLLLSVARGHWACPWARVWESCKCQVAYMLLSTIPLPLSVPPSILHATDRL